MPLGDDVRRHEGKLAEHDIELVMLKKDLERYQERAEERHGELLKAIDGKRSKGSDEGGRPLKVSLPSPVQTAQFVGALIAAVLAGLAGAQLTLPSGEKPIPPPVERHAPVEQPEP